jgi:hypothetical protein
LGWILALPSFLLLISSLILGIISIVKCIISYRQSKTKINNLSLGIAILNIIGIAILILQFTE